MRTPSKLNLRAEKYERIGLENPTVGIASSWECETSFRERVNNMGRASG
jgi:hypothetical protein